MPDLIAQGTEAQQRWRRTLPEGETIVLGRLGGAWAVPWDRQVSHRHASLLWNGSALEVVRLPDARNAVFLRGIEVDRCTIRPGEHFVIGQTNFTLADQQVNVTADAPAPVQQQSFSSQYLKQVHFRNPDHRIEVLSRLPDVISGAAGDQELFVRLVSMLLAGVPRADAAAVVAVEGEGETWRRETGDGETRRRGDAVGARCSPHRPRLLVSPSPPRPLSPSRPPLGPTAGHRRRFPAEPESDSGIAAAAAERVARVARHGVGRARTVHRQRHLRLGVLHAGARQGVPRLGALRGGAIQRRAVGPDALDRSDRPARGREVHRTGGGHAQFAAADAAAGTSPRHAQPVLLAGGARHAGRRRPRSGPLAARDRSLGPLLRFARFLARVGAAVGRPARAAATGEQRPGRDDAAHPPAGRRGRRFPGRCRDGFLGLAPAARRRRAANLPRRPGHAGRVRRPPAFRRASAWPPARRSPERSAPSIK